MTAKAATVGRVLRQHHLKLSPHDYFRMLTGNLTFGVEGVDLSMKEGEVVCVREYSESEADFGYTGRSCYLFIEDIRPTKKRPDSYYVWTRPAKAESTASNATALVLPVSLHVSGQRIVVARSGIWTEAEKNYLETPAEWIDVAWVSALGRVLSVRKWGELLEALLRKPQLRDLEVLYFAHAEGEQPEVESGEELVEDQLPPAVAWAKSQRKAGKG